jgi:hypothetical protein
VGSEGNGTIAKTGIWRWEVGSSSVFKQTYATPEVSDMKQAPDGTLYAPSITAGEGVARSVSPTAPLTPPALGFELMTNDLDAIGTAANVTMTDIEVLPGSNVLYAIATNANEGTYGYPFRLATFSDNLAVPVVGTAPRDKSVTTGRIDLKWKSISSPLTLWYRYQVATDSRFTNVIVGPDNGTNTRGTAAVVVGLNPGTQYYWRVYVDNLSSSGGATNTTTSKKSAVWSFTPKLGAPNLQSPAYGADEVIQMPTFSWLSVTGATSYEMEVANNPFFANASVKKPLTHTTWTWDDELELGSTYYWRVRAIKSGKGILTNISSWSEAIFTVNLKAAEKAAADVKPQPAPQVTVQAPPATPAPIVTVQPPNITIPPAPAPPVSPVTPGVLWAIIIIGAVLLIAVIVLIVRTRRVP